MTITDIIARFFLSFSHKTMILPIILIGYTFYDRRKWGTAIYLLLFTMIFSKFLKNIWQIPLPEQLNSESYAFPSGHMQGVVAFYGWVIHECRKKIVTLICLGIMVGVGYGLLHFGYHVPRDVIGGIGFGVLSIVAYSYILNKFFAYSPEEIGFLLGLISLGLIYLMPSITFIWLPFGSLVGFASGWTIAKSAPIPVGFKNKILVFIVSTVGISLIKFISTFLLPSALEIFTLYASVGFWIGVAPRIATMMRI